MNASSLLRSGVSLRRGADRRQTRIGWLHGRHSFDTGVDPLGADTHHGVLVVSNHDTIAPGSGFETLGLLDTGDAARLTAAGERRLGAVEPSEVLIWEMHASLSPAASI